MTASHRAWRRSGSLLLVAGMLATGFAAGAHDVEVEGDPENLPGEEHTECQEGMAGEFPCFNIELVEFLPLAQLGGDRTNDIWGWTDPLTGIEYVILGMRNGTAFVELNDHGHPTLRGILPTRTVASSWRDMKVYRNHAYIVSEAPSHGMQVFDLTRLRVQSNGPVLYLSDLDYRWFGKAHNIAINEDTGFAYAVGTNTCLGGLHMIDIEEPAAPRFAGCFAADGYTHDTQCVVYHGPDLEFSGREICLSSNEDTVTIVDLTDKAAPVMLSRSPYFSSRYTHQGWLDEDHHYFFLDDELDERDYGLVTRTFVWDMSSLRAPRLVGAHRSDSTAIDHNQYVVGNHVFQANYRAGIRILRFGDLSKAELVEVAYFDTSPADDRAIFSGTWSVYPYFESGFIVASDINKGLFVLKPDLGAVPECSDGVDNDGDGLRDHPEDPTCVSPEHESERVRLDVELDFGRSLTLLTTHGREWRRRIRLAILGSDTVDVGDIDPASLRLGPGAAEPSGRIHARQRWSLRDRDRDGFMDRVFKFERNEVGLAPDDHEVCLEGTVSGDPFVACHPLDDDESHGDEPDESTHSQAGPAPESRSRLRVAGWRAERRAPGAAQPSMISRAASSRFSLGDPKSSSSALARL